MSAKPGLPPAVEVVEDCVVVEDCEETFTETASFRMVGATVAVDRLRQREMVALVVG
jgi:hypothetical protein